MIFLSVQIIFRRVYPVTNHYTQYNKDYLPFHSSQHDTLPHMNLYTKSRMTFHQFLEKKKFLNVKEKLTPTYIFPLRQTRFKNMKNITKAIGRNFMQTIGEISENMTSKWLKTKLPYYLKDSCFTTSPEKSSLGVLG